MEQYQTGDVVEVNITNIQYGPGAAVGTFNAGFIPPEWAPAIIERVEAPPTDADRARYYIRVIGGFRSGTTSVVDALTIRHPSPTPPGADTAASGTPPRTSGQST